MKLQFLGTGGAFVDFRENYHNNAIVETQAGWVMIDCGATAVQSLKELGIPVAAIAGVLVTHCHGDHVAGLEQLIWERFYTGSSGPDWAVTTIWGAQDVLDEVANGLRPCIQDYNDMNGPRHDGVERLAPRVTFNNDTLTIGGVQFSVQSVPHIPGKPSYGVRAVGGDSEGFYYTSDSVFQPNGLDVPAEVVFHDCTFSPRYSGTVHTHYEELKALPPEQKRRMVLMHHNKVPEGIDVKADGFLDAASKHQVFEV